MDELNNLLDRWQREIFGNSSANPVPILTSIAELIERETEAYLKLPIDPFHNHHPSRAYPDCSLGKLLMSLFKNENFVIQLTTDYIRARANFELHVVSCRLLLDILPGLDSTFVFSKTDNLVEQLLDWAETADYPLQSYATGLLGAAMMVEDVAIKHRDQNNQLVPLLLNRLSQITTNLSSDNIDPKDLVECNEPLNRSNKMTNGKGLKRPLTEVDKDEETVDVLAAKMEKKSSQTSVMQSPTQNECSSSSWPEAYKPGRISNRRRQLTTCNSKFALALI